MYKNVIAILPTVLIHSVYFCRSVAPKITTADSSEFDGKLQQLLTMGIGEVPYNIIIIII